MTTLDRKATVTIETLQKLVAQEWQSEFARFVETGDADERFLHYLDTDEKGKQAVEAAFNAQADALEGLAQALRNPVLEERRPDAPAFKMAEAVEDVMQLPEDQGDRAVEEAAVALGASVGQQNRPRLRSIIRNLEDAVGKVSFP